MTLQRVEINKQKSEGMICQIFLLGLRPKWRSRLTRVYNLQFGWVLGKYLHYIWLDTGYILHLLRHWIISLQSTSQAWWVCVWWRPWLSSSASDDGGGQQAAWWMPYSDLHRWTLDHCRHHTIYPWTRARLRIFTRGGAGLHPNIKIRTICMIFKGLLDSPLKLTLIRGLVLPSLHASKLVSFIARWRIQVEVICVSFDWVAALNV